MKWIKEILERHVNDEGVLDLEAAESELNAEANKHVIPKEQYNNKVTELNETKATLTEIQNSNKDNEDLQGKIDDLSTKLQEAEQERKSQAKEFALKTALTSVGAVDVDYFADKLKTEVELDEEGNLTGFEDKIKDYQTKHPKLFSVSTDDKAQNKTGFNVLDNKLSGGQTPPGVTKESIMAIEDTTERQKAIKENMDLFR